MYNREKVVDIITEGICRSDEYNSNYLLSVDGARVAANSVVDFMIEIGFLNFDKHTGAITEAAHFANTMLGEVPQEGHSNVSESSQAASSETSVVGQNEQTKESCPRCNSKDVKSRMYRYMYCSNCGKTWTR